MKQHVLSIAAQPIHQSGLQYIIWLKDEQVLHPIRTVPIIHEPVETLDVPDGEPGSYQPVRFLGHPGIRNILDGFVDADTGQFYGRADELVAALTESGS